MGLDIEESLLLSCPFIASFLLFRLAVEFVVNFVSDLEFDLIDGHVFILIWFVRGIVGLFDFRLMFI